jgi:DNA polymerase-4
MTPSATPAPPRWIAHLDMDAFYASVELLRYPELRGQPVVIGGRSQHAPQAQPDGTRRFARLRDYAGRGVITTATYEARALGVHSGMGLMKAAALAPDAVLLPVDFDAYRHYSRLFKAAVARLTPTIEDRGIDEIYLDLTPLLPTAHDDPAGRAAARALAEQLQAAVQRATGLSCSIGVTPNKLLAKLASDLDKPHGVTVLTHADLAARVWPLPAKRINGIGPKANERLAALGIVTIGDLARAPLPELIDHFGANYGHWLHAAAHGVDERPVVTYREPKSISRETTFERDLHARDDREQLGALFTRLCQQLAADLQRKGYRARTIGIKLRFDDFKTVTRDLTLSAATDQPDAIRLAAGRCLKKIALDRRLRLLGVRASTLRKASDPTPEPAPAPTSPESLPLFD